MYMTVSDIWWHPKPTLQSTTFWWLSTHASFICTPKFNLYPGLSGPLGRGTRSRTWYQKSCFTMWQMQECLLFQNTTLYWQRIQLSHMSRKWSLSSLGKQNFPKVQKSLRGKLLSSLGTSNDIIAGNDRERFMIELKFIMKCFFKALFNF